jgi:hypothetical protein
MSFNNRKLQDQRRETDPAGLPLSKMAARRKARGHKRTAR